MRVLDDRGAEIASICIDVDPTEHICNPKVSTCGLLVEGPEMKLDISRDSGKDGLCVSIALRDLPGMSLLIEKSDIENMKSLMNKDVMKFMVKALL